MVVVAMHISSSMRTHMSNIDEQLDLVPLSTIQGYLVQHNPQYLDYYLDNTLDTLLDAFYYLTMTFSRRTRGRINCEAITYWGEVFTARGNTHIEAGCRAIYKALRHIGGRGKVDYYQQYL